MDTFKRFDAADFLETEEDVAQFLQAIMEDSGDDPATIASALGAVARARNMSKLARDSGLTREGLYKALSAGGNPSFATIVKVANALGLKVKFEPAGTPGAG
jgi:probable addiction module antidote protein